MRSSRGHHRDLLGWLEFRTIGPEDHAEVMKVFFAYDITPDFKEVPDGSAGTSSAGS